MEKRLYKSAKDKKVSGVLGGVAEYFKIDSALVRIGFIVTMIATAVIPCALVYLLCSWVLPEEVQAN